MLNLLLTVAPLSAANISPEPTATLPADTIRLLHGVMVTAALKSDGQLYSQPVSFDRLATQLTNHGVTHLSNLGTMVPNFFMPEYGSRQTSAIYLRGIGSRIGTPSVALYVDNVPYYDKSAFDFGFLDVGVVDVLRGPQSTLYGRNAMGGLVQVQTRNPLQYQGTDVRLGFSTADNRREFSLSHYNRVSNRLAFSASAYYDGNDGLFRNTVLDARAGGATSLGGRLRAVYQPTTYWTIDAVASYEYTDEDAYPYYYAGVADGAETLSSMIGQVCSNLPGNYRRNLINASLNAEYRPSDHWVFNSVTAWQQIDDRMFMDQDFSATDLYSLEQRQHINTLSQELLLKSTGFEHWSSITGVNLLAQWQDIQAPVTFRADGVAWLNRMISVNASNNMPVVNAGPMTMSFAMSDCIQQPELVFDDDFQTPVLGAALFHQSTFRHLFGVDGLSATVGLRLDYEHLGMDFSAWYDFEHEYSLNGNLQGPGGNPIRQIPMVPATQFSTNRHFKGKLTDHHLEFLPKLSVNYDFTHGNVYALYSRGFRSGGYNAQNISEVLRSSMQADMMRDVADATIPVLQAQPQVPDAAKQQVTAILTRLSDFPAPDFQATCSYRPEYCDNFEVGLHYHMFSQRLVLKASAFYSRVSDLQLSRMSATGLGRTVTNAGSSRNRGFELSLVTTLIPRLRLTASAGYSHSTFHEYSVVQGGQEVSCNGLHVPYMPEHTSNVDIAYTIPISDLCIVRNFTVAATITEVGRIYWDELNLHEQAPYATLGARVVIPFLNGELTLWGKNLIDKRYDTFWFETMNNGFAQQGRPRQFGITYSLTIL